MKVVTANRLADGAVVYLDGDGGWTGEIIRARRIDAAESETVLALAKSRVTEIAAAYLVEIGEDGAPAGRERVRENIWRRGPTVRPDLGRKETVA